MTPIKAGPRLPGDSNNTLNTWLERRATGLKINPGKDDPAGLIAGESLRSQITVIEQSIQSSHRAGNVIAATDSALSKISGPLNEIRVLVLEGLNTGALSQPEREADQRQIDKALSAVNRISANAVFAGDKLIEGSSDEAQLSDTGIDAAVFARRPTLVVDATITAAAMRAMLYWDFTSGGAHDGFLVFPSKDFGPDQFIGIKAQPGALVTSSGSVDGTVVSIIEEALDRVTTLRGRLGALQKSVIASNITSQRVALETITEARGPIIDTDFTEETADCCISSASRTSACGLRLDGPESC